MSTHKKERIEKIQQAIVKLAEESIEGNPVVVEGKKDAQALVELGVNGKILTLKTGGKSNLETINQIEALGAREVILLLDFDRRGIESMNRLQRELEHLRVKASTKTWVDLRALVNRDVQCIESLPAYLTTAQQKVNLNDLKH